MLIQTEATTKALIAVANAGGVLTYKELAALTNTSHDDARKLIQLLALQGYLKDTRLPTNVIVDPTKPALILYQLTARTAEALEQKPTDQIYRPAVHGKLLKSYTRLYAQVNASSDIRRLKSSLDMEQAFTAAKLPLPSTKLTAWPADVYYTSQRLFVLHALNPDADLNAQLRFIFAAWKEQQLARPGVLKHAFVVPAHLVQELSEILPARMPGINTPLTIDPLDEFLTKGGAAIGATGMATNYQGYALFNAQLSTTYRAWPGAPSEMRAMAQELDKLLTQPKPDLVRARHLIQRLRQSPKLWFGELSAEQKKAKLNTLKFVPTGADPEVTALREFCANTLNAADLIRPEIPAFSRDAMSGLVYQGGELATPRSCCILFHTFLETKGASNE